MRLGVGPGMGPGAGGLDNVCAGLGLGAESELLGEACTVAGTFALVLA